MNQGLRQARVTSRRAASRRRIITTVLAVAVVGLCVGGFGERTGRAQAGGGCTTPTFAPAQNFGVGDGSRFVTTADFNSDGKADLATANFTSANVSVLLGDGQGGFVPAGNFAVGDYPQFVAAADFNADGNTDLATANQRSDDVSVLLGDGAGGFAPAVNFGVGNNPRSVTTADFNRDVIPDLAVANSGLGSTTVSVLLGDGRGGFSAAVPIEVGKTPYSVTAGDFNGDGRADLATANGGSDNVSVLLNTCAASAAPGSGTEGLAATLPR